MLGRDPGVDGAANRFDRSSLHDRASNISRSAFSLKPKKRGPFQLVPVMAKATLERIGLAVPGKTISHHHHPLRLSVPLPDQNSAGSKLGSLLVKAGQTADI